jgi:flagellar M-ring protein FliF
VDAEKQKVPSAAVTLGLDPAKRLTPTHVSAMVHLVTNSVPGLDPQHISVITARGQVLWNGRDASKPGAQPDAIEQYQRSLEERLTSMLAPVVGESRCVVRVAATLDFSEKEVRTERYLPGTTPRVRQRQSLDENYKGAPQPVKSTRSNDYGRKNENVQFELDRETSHEVIPPGRVKRLHVAVLLDQRAVTSVNTMRIEALVSITHQPRIVSERGSRAYALARMSLPPSRRAV